MRPVAAWSRAFAIVAVIGFVGACDDESTRETRDGSVEHGADDASVATPGPLPVDTRWLKSVERIDHAQIAALPDGGVLLVTVVDRADYADRAPQPEYATTLRAYGADGAERWSRMIIGTWFNLPWGAPAVAVHSSGDVYLTLGGFDAQQSVTSGDETLECSDACGAMAAFDAAGKLRWLRTIPQFQSHWLTPIDDGVVLAMTFGGPPVLTAIAANGDPRWEQPYPLRFPDMRFGGYVAGDGADGFYLAGQRGACGMLEHRSGSDGALTWEREVCGEAFEVTTLSDAVALGDGTVIARANGRGDERELRGFNSDGKPAFSFGLPYDARPSAGGAAALLVAASVGPVAAVDAKGDAQWQWPGALVDGALAAHPSGLCDGSAVPAPDGDIYVLTRACAGARALLGAAPISETWSGDLDDFPYEDWLLARVHVRELEYEPRCGNGWIDPGEECDGEEYDFSDEPSPGMPVHPECGHWLRDTGGISGEPDCSASCTVDLSPCKSSCGNGRLDEGEGCDGKLFAHAQSCDEAGVGGVGLGHGPLGCNDCVVDLDVCPMRASCGNGMLEEWEECDGLLWPEAFGPHTCPESTPGLITCMDCRALDYSACM